MKRPWCRKNAGRAGRDVRARSMERAGFFHREPRAHPVDDVGRYSGRVRGVCSRRLGSDQSTPARLGALGSVGFVQDLDSFTLEELDNEPVYRDFLRKRGLGWATGTVVDPPSSDPIIFSFERAYAKGPVPSRSCSSSTSCVRIWRAARCCRRGSVWNGPRRWPTCCNPSDYPARFLRDTGSILAANRALERLIPSLLQDRRERLYLTDVAADALLETALARRAAGPGRRQFHSRDRDGGTSADDPSSAARSTSGTRCFLPGHVAACGDAG